MSTIERLSKGVGEALSAVMLALLELPRFESEQYFRLLGEILADANPELTVAEALADLGVTFPARPIPGRVRARLEAVLVERSGGEVGLSLAREGLGSGSFSTTWGRSGAASVVVEIEANYETSGPTVDWEVLRNLKVSELLKGGQE